MTDYAIHFIDDARQPVLVQDASFLPRNGDELCLETKGTRTYTRWIVTRVIHNAMVSSADGFIAAPTNVFVVAAPKV